MSSLPLHQIPSAGLAQDLLSRATALLTREATRLHQPQLGTSPSLDSSRGVVPPGSFAEPTEPLATLLASPDLDGLRRRGTELLDALLSALGAGREHPSNGGVGELDRVPLIWALAPVEAGASARAKFRVSNEDPEPTQVSLYSSQFIADSGYDVPALLVSISPHVATIPAGGDTTFDVEVRVPSQAPRGLFSGLVQALGCKYVKAVIMFEVL